MTLTTQRRRTVSTERCHSVFIQPRREQMAAMVEAQVVDLDAWEAAGRPSMPRWVVVCDELARLTIGNAGETREERATRERTTALLCDIARLGRAAGVHLVVCTQRPDADAVPGQLKANLAGTVAFRVRNEANSRILLDCDRAALLPCHQGRAIWQDHQMEEFQAIYLDSDECLRMIEDRWLREVGGFEDPEAIRRWSRRSTPALARGCSTTRDAVRTLVASTTAAATSALHAVLATLRASGAGGTPAADQGDGCAVADASAPGTTGSTTPTPAVAPSSITLSGRVTTRDQARDEQSATRVVPLPTQLPGGSRLTECRQSTEESASRPEETG